tara:strand:- start:396 stop:1325 length:930 start_codon:yes stop_codon:yes gene_type:complete
MRPILHVGFGKTSTSYLQEIFFPEILKSSNRLYWKEDEKLSKQVLLHRDKMIYNDDFHKVILPENIFISLETLMGPSGWDPEYYEKFAELNLKAFGSNCEILFTIREPYGWLSSNYSRNIGKLNIIPESKFYVSNQNYKHYKLRDKHCLTFALQKFSYKKVFEIYSKRFSKITILKYENLKDLNIWEKVLNSQLNLSEDSVLIKDKILNRGLSKSSIRLTIKTDNFLKLFGLGIEKLHRFNKFLRFKNNSNIIKKYFNIFLNLCTWKKLLNFLDRKIFKYEKYELTTNKFIRDQIDRLNKEYKEIKEIF